MVEIFESVMLICFGISWPISVYKSITSRSAKGKSAVFMAAILFGYISGIAGKITGGEINYVLALYVFNFVIVSIDLTLYFINKRREKNSDDGLLSVIDQAQMQ